MGRDDLVASAAYQPEPTAAAAARRFVRGTLQSWLTTGAGADGHGLVDDAVLLTSELVTNAVVHAGTSVQVTCKLAGGEVEVVVSDCHPARLVPEVSESEQTAAERTGGRGLLLPAALASAWGVTYGRTAKAVWFRLGPAGLADPGDDSSGGPDTAGGFESDMAGGSALAAALRSGAENNGITSGGPADRDYHRLLTAAAEAARAAVGAEGAFVLMADEDGDLRLRATAGALPLAPDMAVPGNAGGRRAARRPGRPALAWEPSVLTVPFVVDGRVTGLLATASATPGRFGEAETVKLQRLADSCGPGLQRAWLDELERVRRGRIAALGYARGLLTSGLSEKEIMALAGGAAVPGLAPWCAVLLPAAGGALRPVYARHQDEGATGALTRLLERACETAPPPPVPGHPAGPGPGWRWRLPAAAASMAGSRGQPTSPLSPPGSAAPPAGSAWCFPVGQPQDGQGLFVIGSDRGDRVSREVAALAGDLACRIGLALARSAGLMPARQP